MLRVTIEIVPFGYNDLARTLDIITISNIGGTLERGNYEIKCGDEKYKINYYERKRGYLKLVQGVVKLILRHRGEHDSRI